MCLNALMSKATVLVKRYFVKLNNYLFSFYLIYLSIIRVAALQMGIDWCTDSRQAATGASVVATHVLGTM